MRGVFEAGMVLAVGGMVGSVLVRAVRGQLGAAVARCPACGAPASRAYPRCRRCGAPAAP